MESAIYRGQVWHKRFAPKVNEFRYQVFMLYLDLAELDQVFTGTCLWSQHKPALARFRREDFMYSPELPLDTVVRDVVAAEVGERPTGPIRLLANLRYFGFIINPISCYYCFDESGEQLQYLVAEVTNTPWGERCHYVLDYRDKEPTTEQRFAKDMHVSPFLPMALQYHWRASLPGDTLKLRIADYADTEKVFDSSLNLTREAISPAALRRTILSYPWMTLKVAAAIYWQALKLSIKLVPFVPNPGQPLETNNAKNQ